MKSTKKHYKGLVLLSSGIDSPVASYMMLKKGVELVGVHFDNQPLINQLSMEKAKKLVQHLAKVCKTKIKFYVVSHGPNQVEIIKHCNRKYQCVICRRIMFRIGEAIAEKEKCNFLVTGENLAQVASQTVENLAVTSEAVNIPILRPLLCNDKEETIRLAKKIGTYPISIQASVCCAAVPKHPATKAKLKIVKFEEKKVDIKKLVEDSVRTLQEFIY